MQESLEDCEWYEQGCCGCIPQLLTHKMRLPYNFAKAEVGTVRKIETNAAPGVTDPSPPRKVKIKPGFHKLAESLQELVSTSLQARPGCLHVPRLGVLEFTEKNIGGGNHGDILVGEMDSKLPVSLPLQDTG